MTPAFESLGYYSQPDFVALGRAYGVDERRVGAMVDEFRQKASAVERLVRRSFLTREAQDEYLRLFHDRLMMFR